MKLRLDYITICLLLLGYYVPQYAILGKISVVVTVAIMGIMALAMISAYTGMLRVTRDHTKPVSSNQSKLWSLVVFVTLVGLTAQAGYYIETALILVFTTIVRICKYQLDKKGIV